MKTFAAPAERAGDEELTKSIESVWKSKFIKELYNAVTDIVLVLNKQRQVVFYNENLLKVLGLEEGDNYYGQRPGELIGCVHAEEMEAGCGTSKLCTACGALTAILNGLENEQDIQECRITRNKNGEALDLLVKTTPLTLGGEQFVISSIVDISSEKRKKVLERIFFHDILNTAGSIRAISELLQEAEPEEIEKFRSLMYNNADKLIDEIYAQRDLTAAENNELVVNFDILESREILKGILDLYSHHDIAENRKLVFAEKSVAISISSDKTLLSRILGNMTKNALEACNDGDTVKIGCDKNNNKITFWVHNPSYIPEDVQLKLFKRSFSTKGTGRGIGTYSMRLLSEKYLNGVVEFTSDPQEGTTFRATYPVNL